MRNFLIRLIFVPSEKIITIYYGGKLQLSIGILIQNKSFNISKSRGLKQDSIYLKSKKMST